MKKVALFIAVCASALLLSGCGSEKTMTCTGSISESGITMDLNYVVNYKGDYITSVKLEETIESDDATQLETLKTTIEDTYADYKDIDNYDVDVKIDGNKLLSTTTINYAKIDTDKLIEINPAAEQLLKNGKVAVDDFEAAYKLLGLTCKK